MNWKNGKKKINFGLAGNKNAKRKANQNNKKNRFVIKVDYHLSKTLYGEENKK